jgi:hypothetical protein
LNGDFEGAITRWWIGQMENRQAVTSRKKIVIALLIKAIRRFAHEPEVEILSVASGSAQAVVEAILPCPDIRVKVA